MKRKPGWKDRVARVEDVVAQEFEEAAMQRIRAGLGGDIDLSAGRASALGGEEHRVDMEFLNGVGGNRKADEALLRLIDDIGCVDAVVGEVVVVQATAAEADAALVASARVDGAGSQRRQGRPVSAVQWQILHLF